MSSGASGDAGGPAGTALVLGGGGLAAVGWEAGVLTALVRAGADLGRVDTLVGTSAGSIVALRIAEGRIEQWYESVLTATPAPAPDADLRELTEAWGKLVTGATSAADARMRIGRWAMEAATITPAQRSTEIAELLPTTHWPDRRILVAAVSVGTGTLRAFTREDGVPLLDAVGASCAVPGVWPPVALDGDLWLDGAVASNTNVPLATGAGRVVVLAPMPPAGPALERELSRLGERVRSYVLTADADATRSFGDNPFDPRTAATAAREGLRQGTGAAADILALLDHEGVEQS